MWTIPREKAKNDRAQVVPLSAEARTLLKEIKAGRAKQVAAKHSSILFTTNGMTPVSGFSRAKARLDQEMERLARDARGLPLEEAPYRAALGVKEGAPTPAQVGPWMLHDLRRTAATGMAKLKVAPHVVEKVLNHTSGTIRGVAAIYNRHDYDDERKEALAAWGGHVAAIMRLRRRKALRLATSDGAPTENAASATALTPALASSSLSMWPTLGNGCQARCPSAPGLSAPAE